ncbi:hypothetical protein A5765_03895 [Mycolicibacterium celeriflavum]|uniref:Uncharacterized protein n=1 Tax=Mycolicibacterium celeriflavum TaxID=1249101 RepID=A0A1X0C0B0_MYCCF|nr:hypothetical protein [Mycolicibacterium celeriflavum]MCV7238962.1 hypothetical protein [Mycolicibacterium celeriflavum]OBG18532.1 hypothetical protein A5765_03895 [Mycolicibacterium celeriflavum]ORA50482.1 hypothetical protein BST21_04480 [Mycolicibacterium celeriflavum]BBY45201.1 hypothetical protein MCEL_34960 [Mycolicibacterium celeriflavum]
MMLTRAMAVAAAIAGVAIGSASPAWADGRLEGDFRFVNGATSNTWAITTQCNPEGFCAGTVSSSTGMIAHISRGADGPWIVERHDVPNGWTCPDGSTGPGDLSYAFDAATLAGTATYTSKPGACNDPNAGRHENPISLQPL